jgi:NADH-quinone oxidoreductase subunit M
MHLYDLPTGVPWLSLIWLSMLLPALIMMFMNPEQKQTIRIIGTVFAFISMALSLLVIFAYDYIRPQKLQFD